MQSPKAHGPLYIFEHPVAKIHLRQSKIDDCEVHAGKRVLRRIPQTINYIQA